MRRFRKHKDLNPSEFSRAESPMNSTMLGGIFGYLELARVSCEATRRLPAILKELSKHLLVPKTLSATPYVLKGGVPVRKTGSIAPLLKESTQFALSGSSVSCSFHIADELWLCDFDEDQMGKVGDNIVINSVQAMPLSGSISVAAANFEIKNGEMSSLKRGKYVHVSFTDTGIGIPVSILPSIFDPFFTTKHKAMVLAYPPCIPLSRNMMVRSP